MTCWSRSSAASINPLDKMVRNGEFKRLLKYRTPFVLGHDVAGVVTRVGSGVRDFQVGDEVYARPRDLRIGTFAEYIAIDQDDVAPKPASLTLHEAAAVPLVSLAAWQALVDRAHVQPGQKVLVHAGSGGLGSTVIQLAKHLGATVATTARGENAELVRSLGADVVVDYTKEDFAEVLSGYDVVLDSLGGENLEKSLTVLKPGGQAIGVAGPPDPGFAKQLGAPKFIGVAMGLLSRKDPQAGPQARRRATRSCGCRPTAPNCASSLPSTTLATFAPSSIRRSRSTRPSRRWRTSSRATPTARSSSRSIDNRERRLSRRDGAEDRAARASAAAPIRRSRDRPAATLSTPSADGRASR